MNHVLKVAVIGWFAAQFIKILIELARTKKINLQLIMASGGMPSSHSSFTVSAATAIGFQEGFGSAVVAPSAEENPKGRRGVGPNVTQPIANVTQPPLGNTPWS